MTVSFVHHDLQTFVEIAVDMLHKHGVMISAVKNMAIDLEKVKGFAADTKEFAVFVEHNSVTKAVLHDDLHYR